MCWHNVKYVNVSKPNKHGIQKTLCPGCSETSFCQQHKWPIQTKFQVSALIIQSKMNMLVLEVQQEKKRNTGPRLAAHKGDTFFRYHILEGCVGLFWVVFFKLQPPAQAAFCASTTSTCRKILHSHTLQSIYGVCPPAQNPQSVPVTIAK